METKYTKKVLDNYRKILVEELKRQLKKPNSNLEKSIVGEKLTGKDGFSISMNDYGLNVNQGRSAGKFPGKPPLQNIQDWIDRKKIKPKEQKDGKIPSLKQLSFLIGRSIAQKGIKPTRFIDIVIEKVEPKLTIDIANAYLKDLNVELDKKLKNVGSKG